DAIRGRVDFGSRRSHLLALLTALDAPDPAQKTDIYEILEEVAATQNRRGIVVIVSDLFVPREGLFRGLRMLRRRGHDVLIFHVMDDEELDFSYTGTTRFEGLEEAGELVCDPRSLRDGYLEAVEAFRSELRKRCAAEMVDFQTIRTSEHLDAALAHYLNHRIGMRQSIRS
ncbi:MAG TPA: DUF58 domain-containing protein, partial [Planctomycetaceae bacterium]|nr:DUF58 domain-containing protein [Planctomycetaceae bacterium]